MNYPNKYDAHLKVKKTLQSIDQQKQIPSGRRMVRNFLTMFNVPFIDPLRDELDIELLMTENRVYPQTPK